MFILDVLGESILANRFANPLEALAKPPATLRLTACLAGRPAG